MIHRWSQKNPRPSKGRVPGYTMYQDMLGSDVPDITTLTTILHKRFRPHCVPTAIAWYFKGQENTLDRQYVIKTHHMICEKCLRMSLLKTNATYLHEQFLATTRVQQNMWWCFWSNPGTGKLTSGILTLENRDGNVQMRMFLGLIF